MITIECTDTSNTLTAMELLTDDTCTISKFHPQGRVLTWVDLSFRQRKMGDRIPRWTEDGEMSPVYRFQTTGHVNSLSRFVHNKFRFRERTKGNWDRARILSVSRLPFMKTEIRWTENRRSPFEGWVGIPLSWPFLLDRILENILNLFVIIRVQISIRILRISKDVLLTVSCLLQDT